MRALVWACLTGRIVDPAAVIEEQQELWDCIGYLGMHEWEMMLMAVFLHYYTFQVLFLIAQSMCRLYGGR